VPVESEIQNPKSQISTASSAVKGFIFLRPEISGRLWGPFGYRHYDIILPASERVPVVTDDS
jgi:hypothetical protein